MRADIHDGPEQPLQSEAGYIDARPQRRQIDEILLRRTAGPYIGSKTPFWLTGQCGWRTPETGPAGRPRRRVPWAKCRHSGSPSFRPEGGGAAPVTATPAALPVRARTR